MTSKRRLSSSIDADLIDAGQAAVEAGEAENLSAWVNDALRQKVDHERKLRALGEALADFDAEHGEITEEESDAIIRRMRQNAIVVRGGVILENGEAR